MCPCRRRAEQSKALISMVGRGDGLAHAASGAPMPMGSRAADAERPGLRTGRQHPLPRAPPTVAPWGGQAWPRRAEAAVWAAPGLYIKCTVQVGQEKREKPTRQDARPTLHAETATRQKFKKIRIRQSDRAAPSGAPPHPSRPPPGRASVAAHLPALAPPAGPRPPTSATPTRPIEQQPERGRGSGCPRPGRARRSR